MTSTTIRSGLCAIALAAGGGIAAAAPAAADCAQVAQYVVTAESLTVRADPGGNTIIGTLYRGGKFNDRGDDGRPSWRFGWADGVGYGWALKSGMAYSRTITVCH